MPLGQTPSRTAHAAAAHRAAHQVLEGGRIFSDPLAVRILASTDQAIASDAELHPRRRLMRLFIAVRGRFAEDAVAAAVARGVRQLVVLGAGLDTFAYRNPYTTDSQRLAVFEVDHPATQAWKRGRLAEVGLPVPPWLTFAPVDFERQTMADGLQATGFDPARPAIVTWLGVVPYLTHDAVFATLGWIASLREAEVVFDYAEPPEALAGDQRAAHELRAARVAAAGEPWITYFTPARLATDLRALGFSSVEDLGPAEIGARFFGRPSTQPGRSGGHVLRAFKSD
jgi:methyltransferase (TIGR00027 family)